MQDMIVARRYALGIALEAESSNVLEPVAEGLAFFAQQIRDKTELFAVIDNPAFRKDEREAVIREICKRGAFSDLVVDVLCLLIRKERLRLLPVIEVAFVKIVDEMLGRARAYVSSAKLLDDKAQAAIFAALGKMLGKKVVGVVREDPSLLGGVKAQIDGLVLDGTVRGRLETLEQNMVN